MPYFRLRYGWKFVSIKRIGKRIEEYRESGFSTLKNRRCQKNKMLGIWSYTFIIHLFFIFVPLTFSEGRIRGLMVVSRGQAHFLNHLHLAPIAPPSTR